MRMLEFLFVPTILFLVVVAPIWIVMHYRSVKSSSRKLEPHDLETVEKMLATLNEMSDRIEALESILEHDHPNWRKHVHARDEKQQESAS